MEKTPLKMYLLLSSCNFPLPDQFFRAVVTVPFFLSFHSSTTPAKPGWFKTWLVRGRILKMACEIIPMSHCNCRWYFIPCIQQVIKVKYSLLTVCQKVFLFLMPSKVTRNVDTPNRAECRKGKTYWEKPPDLDPKPRNQFPLYWLVNNGS